MQSPDELRQENEALRDRVSRLSSAILRISASLDLSTVLQEVVDSARALTGARYGVITIFDDEGQVQEFITSGFTAEEHQELAGWAEGPRLLAHFRDLAEPLRLRDLPSYVRSLGFSSDLMRSMTLLGTSIRNQGVQIGSFFLAEKEGGSEFMSGDEEVLVLFASQAAAAIVNARTHRVEQQARADLEVLVDTSPVGIIIFAARTGKPVSLNREARRIVESLRAPDLPPEELHKVVMCRRADGREVALNQFPMAHQTNSFDTVRAEEVVLSVPDGRSVTTLLNATPVRSADGTVESIVVTLQDLAPIEELERSRAEFLGLVSHELRAPLTSIKGSTTTVLSAQPSPNPAETLQIIRIIDGQADHMRSLINDLLDAGHIETGTLSISPEPSEVVSLVEQARNTFLSGGGRHDVLIDLPLDLPLVMADRQRIVQVMNNLLSNAAKYSSEAAPIRIAAAHEGVHVAVSISDEGRGVPPDLLPHLFRKHARVGEERGIRGSGLGLAISKGLVEAHGGRIRAESAGAGTGTRFTFTVPVADDARIGAAGGAARSGSPSPRMDRDRTRILVVDDDPRTLHFVQDALAAAGFTPLVTGDPRDVSRLIHEKKPRLVLLDLVLPETDGIELMRDVPELADLPVVFISGYGRDETIAKALGMGAADYIVKPFSTTELTARVKAALQRRYGSSESFRLGDLAIRYEDRQVTVAGRPVQLTATEYELLRALAVNAGRILTFDSLLRQVWGRTETGDRRVVHAFVKRLRHKLGDDAASPSYIFTERHVGYRIPRPGEPERP